MSPVTRSTCAKCGGRISLIIGPEITPGEGDTDDWWVHDVHPMDNHDAVEAGHLEPDPMEATLTDVAEVLAECRDLLAFIAQGLGFIRPIGQNDDEADSAEPDDDRTAQSWTRGNPT